MPAAPYFFELAHYRIQSETSFGMLGVKREVDRGETARQDIKPTDADELTGQSVVHFGLGNGALAEKLPVRIPTRWKLPTVALANVGPVQLVALIAIPPGNQRARQVRV